MSANDENENFGNNDGYQQMSSENNRLNFTMRQESSKIDYLQKY